MYEFKLNTSCRTCLKESCEMKPMSTKWEDSIELWEMLIYFTDQCQKSNIPYNICSNCESTLISSYSFKKMCLETESRLAKFLNETLLKDEDIDYEESSEYVEELHQAIIWDAKSTTVLDENYLITETEEILSVPLESIDDNHENVFNTTEPIEMLPEQIHQIESTPIKDECLRYKHDSSHKLCRLCNLKFDDVKAYQLHHRQVHRVRTLCPFCGKLVSKHSMEKHMISHTKAKDHLCTECGKSFTLDENLKKHWRIHSGDKRYTCEHCGEKFIHWNSKRSHIRTTHTGEKKYECNICGKRFAQSSNMFRHIRQHTGELPHECRYCNKKFMTTTELRNHLVVHTKEKNELCDVCQKAFGTRKALRAHLKTHTGERNYVCTVCEKAFTQAHVLRTHLKTHPDCPIPPPGVILSQKALNRPPKLIPAVPELIDAAKPALL